MNVFRLFRFSIVAAPVLTLAGMLYTPLAKASFSQNWRDLLAWNGDGGFFPDEMESTPVWIWFLLGPLALFVLLALVNQVLLFFYWKPSRLIFLVSCLVGWMIMPSLGLIVLTPIESVLYDMAAVFSGVTLALAFYSPVAERFKR